MIGGLCSRFAVFVHRFGEATDRAKCKDWVRSLWIILRPSFYILRYFSVIMCKIFFQEGTELGKGVRFSSKGNILVGAERIGNNCVIHHNVTFGMHLADKKDFKGRPTIGNDVWIGPESIIYGSVSIGDGVTILAGTVLTKNIPANCVVSGNPAKILHRGFNNGKLLASASSEVADREFEKWLKQNV